MFVKMAKEVIENSILKQKLKDKLEELKKEYIKELENNSTKAFILKCQITIVEEILYGRKLVEDGRKKAEKEDK